MCDDPDCPYDPDEHHPDEWTGEYEADSNGREYNPYSGSKTPSDGRCNALLTNWEERYGDPRYCTQLPMETFVEDGSEFCSTHRGRDGLMERASELLTHGLYAKTIHHVFEKLSPWQQLTVLGWYDDYVQESTYAFDESLETQYIDFSDFGGEMPLEVETHLDENSQLPVDVPVPTDHAARCFALFRAAVMDIKAGLADRALLETEDGTTAMEREQVVSVTDEGYEITDEAEHHLNLPLSRIDKDKDELLAFGGVPIDSDSNVEMNVGEAEELVFDLDDSPSDQITEEDTVVGALEDPALEEAGDAGVSDPEETADDT